MFSPDGALGQGSTPSPANSDAGVGTGATLTGLVSELFGEDLMLARPLSQGELQISTPTTTGTARASFDGTNPYVLRGINAQVPLWIAVAPGTGAATITTLQLVDASSGEADLAAVDRDVLDNLSMTASLNNPVELDRMRGHIVIALVDSLGRPLAGVSVVTSLGTTVAYDAGATFSDQLLATDNRGAILILNVPASALPGRDQTVSLSTGSTTFTVTARVARDAITLVGATL